MPVGWRRRPRSGLAAACTGSLGPSGSRPRLGPWLASAKGRAPRKPHPRRSPVYRSAHPANPRHTRPPRNTHCGSNSSHEIARISGSQTAVVMKTTEDGLTSNPHPLPKPTIQRAPENAMCFAGIRGRPSPAGRGQARFSTSATGGKAKSRTDGLLDGSGAGPLVAGEHPADDAGLRFSAAGRFDWRP